MKHQLQFCFSVNKMHNFRNQDLTKLNVFGENIGTKLVNCETPNKFDTSVLLIDHCFMSEQQRHKACSSIKLIPSKIIVQTYL